MPAETCTGNVMPTNRHHQIVIVGGGTAGITVAAQLCRGWFSKPDVALIEPSSQHYYQPLWTLVGGGVFPKERTVRDEASVIPRKAKWIQEAVTEFFPDENYLTTESRQRVDYEYLIVAAGIQIDWDGIKGLKDAIGHDGVCSNYSYHFVDSTWECIRNFKGGNAIFTNPSGAIKCGGAPQKIMYLAEDYFRRAGVRDRSHVIFVSAGERLFGIPKYAPVLEEIVQRRGIETRFRHNLIEIRPQAKEAIFNQLGEEKTVPLHYDMIHVTPPMSSPDFIRNSPLANKDGWVEVDPYTLRHLRYGNVFGLGDAASLPTAKTGAAVRKQAPVLVKNLCSVMRGETPAAKYNGYTSCPIVTRYGRVVLAEFDYDKNPVETFPFDQSKERYSMWLLKTHLLPLLYWKGMLKGRA